MEKGKNERCFRNSYFVHASLEVEEGLLRLMFLPLCIAAQFCLLQKPL